MVTRLKQATIEKREKKRQQFDDAKNKYFRKKELYVIKLIKEHMEGCIRKKLGESLKQTMHFTWLTKAERMKKAYERLGYKLDEMRLEINPDTTVDDAVEYLKMVGSEDKLPEFQALAEQNVKLPKFLDKLPKYMREGDDGNDTSNLWQSVWSIKINKIDGTGFKF